jgi:protein-S-isoprenylcysteine O-methyltransferase Ste14
VLHREANPFQRVIGLAMGLFMLAVLAWSVLHVVLGDAGLGIWRAPDAIGWLGWGLVAAGLFLTVLAQAQMGASWRIGIDTARTELVTGGLFSVVRNPIFTGMLAMVSGIVLVTPSAWTVMALGHYVLLVSLQVRLEEEHLLRLHGDAYRAYAARVGRFLPGVGRLATRLRAEVAPA